MNHSHKTFKIILKTQDRIIETAQARNPYAAYEKWKTLRTRPLDNQPIILLLLYYNRVFIEHHFNADPENPNHVALNSVSVQTFIDIHFPYNHPIID